MTPTLIYYLLLFALVFVIKGFKEYRAWTNDGRHFKWNNIIFVSLEIVYTSAGYIILLLDSQRKWIPVIVMFYVLLVYTSSNLDMADKMGVASRTLLHFIIIIIFIWGAFFTFNNALSTKPVMEGRINREIIHNYRISIPYIDTSLVMHLGYGKIGEKRLVYYTTIKAKTEREAIDDATKLFWTSTSSNPFIYKLDVDKKSLVIIDESNIMVKYLD